MKYVLEWLFPDMKEGDYTVAIVILCVTVALWLVTAVARWRTFNKMGVAGWKAFIPLYGYYVIFSKCWSKKAGWSYVCATIICALFEAGFFKGATGIILTLCTIGELIFAIELLYLTVRINFRMSRAFGHGFLFGLGLWIFPFIFTFILGFGRSKYVGSKAR